MTLVLFVCRLVKVVDWKTVAAGLSGVVASAVEVSVAAVAAYFPAGTAEARKMAVPAAVASGIVAAVAC